MSCDLGVTMTWAEFLSIVFLSVALQLIGRLALVLFDKPEQK